MKHTIKNNVITLNIQSPEDRETCDQAIDKETKRRVAKVTGAGYLGVRTACWIDGEFIVSSDYDLTDQMIDDLRQLGDIA